MKILFVCNEYPPLPHGGIGSFTKLMAESLVKEGHEVFVMGYGNEAQATKADMNGVQVMFLKKAYSSKLKVLSLFYAYFNRWAFSNKIKTYAKQKQVDIIETYEWSAPLILKPKNIPLVVRLHGSNTANNEYMQKKKSSVFSRLEKRAIRIADHVISVSEHIAEITQKSFQIKFPYTCIYNGVDTLQFKDFSYTRDLNQILWVGRMHPYKGLEYLFDALNQVFEQNPSVYFSLACSINENYKIQLLARVNAAHHARIQFLGRINHADLPELYNKANLCIHPSLSEAMPIIPLEAMACGTLVILSDRFSAREIVNDNENGFLVNVLNKVELANKILAVLANQAQIETMRPKARGSIEQSFSQENIIQQNIQFYQSILNNA
ncbi:MAG: glycosyltransferase family 4 protein [Crocinitomicaceae bacterium]|nr:glycosyltransferase family 4 protein [Crocinitomicaceae bacterium]